LVSRTSNIIGTSQLSWGA